MKKILITGGAGFIGSHLAEELIARGDDVSVIDDLTTGSLENILELKTNPRFHFVLGSILEENKIDELVRECDVVYHLAAAVGVKLVFENPVQTMMVNVRGSENILNSALRFAKKVFVASTSEVYGKDINPDTKKFSESDDISLGTSLRWCYACSKAMDEYLAISYHKKMGLPVVVGRFFNTVGPRQTGAYGMVIPRFVGQALAGQPITVFGDGLQVRSFSYVTDIVKAVITLIDDPKANGQVFNIGSEEAVTVMDVAKAVKAKTGSSSEIVKMSYRQAYGGDFEDIRYRVPDLTKIRKAIGYEPTYSFDDILSLIIDYHRKKNSAAGGVL
jgi:UDP-glucose 4-epimerase